MFARVLVVALVATVSVACGSSDEGQGPATAPVGSADGSAPTSTPDDLPQEFCEQFVALDGERPEEYVGSAEHVGDIELLLAVSPTDVSGQIAMYRDYLASGAIDSIDDPDSNVFDNWPSDIQSAVLEIQEFGLDSC